MPRVLACWLLAVWASVSVSHCGELFGWSAVCLEGSAFVSKIDKIIHSASAHMKFSTKALSPRSSVATSTCIAPGWHFMWNFTMGNLVGLSTSGIPISSTVLAVLPHPHKAHWHGGTFGPEVSGSRTLRHQTWASSDWLA